MCQAASLSGQLGQDCRVALSFSFQLLCIGSLPVAPQHSGGCSGGGSQGWKLSGGSSAPWGDALGGRCLTPDSTPALAGSGSVPGLWGQAGKWVVAIKATAHQRMKGQRTKLGRTAVPPCPAQVGGEQPLRLGVSSVLGQQSDSLQDLFWHIPRKKRCPVPMGQGVRSPFSSGTARLAQIEVPSPSHSSLLTAGSDSQHLHEALDYFIYTSGVPGLNIRPCATQQTWIPMFNVGRCQRN